jgi:hypothetical protein
VPRSRQAVKEKRFNSFLAKTNSGVKQAIPKDASLDKESFSTGSSFGLTRKKEKR